MATAAGKSRGRGTLGRLFGNEFLSVATLVLIAAVLVAIIRGAPHWQAVPALVWLHLSLVLVAMALTPVMLLRRKGTRWHRRLGYVWITAMVLTAATTLFFKTGVMGPGHVGILTGDISPIHALSLFVLVLAPIVVVRARQHDRARHERTVRGLVFGALLIAGFFTFPFNRLLGSWLFG